MKSLHPFSGYCSSKKLAMARNACKYGALIFTHRCSLLNPDTTVYPLLAQEGATNGALDVNQSYRWSSENFVGSARISSMHVNSCAANPSSKGDNLHKPRGITER